MNEYLKAIKNYSVFTGRSRRRDYWTFVLFNMIFAIAALILDALLGSNYMVENGSAGFGYIYTLYILFAFLPGLAVAVRRLHDVGKSGWFFLVALIPLVGAIWLLVVLCTDSQSGPNKYGPNPKEVAIDEDTFNYNLQS